MKTMKLLFKQLPRQSMMLSMVLVLFSCKPPVTPPETTTSVAVVEETETIEYYSLRPETEKAYGYTHAVKIGNDIKISGAVSMDDTGAPTAKGDLLKQMKNCYADLDKILKHYGCTFDDVVVENVFTTNMPEFLKQSGYRNSIYTKQFPTGSWLGVKELALPDFLIEIELEVHKSK
jgi:enamine deaminase RidA (YjgF/YER057c/UK114 family)